MKPEEIKSAFSNKSRNHNSNNNFTFGGDKNNYSSLNAHASGAVTDRSNTKSIKKSKSTSVLNSIQQKINQAIIQSQDVKQHDIPKEFGKMMPIKPSKEIKSFEAQTYEFKKEDISKREIKTFKENNYRLNPSFIEPQHSFLQKFQSSNFNLRYQPPKPIGIEETYSLEPKPTLEVPGDNERREGSTQPRAPSPFAAPSEPSQPQLKVVTNNSNYIPMSIKNKANSHSKSNLQESQNVEYAFKNSNAQLEHYDPEKEQKKYKMKIINQQAAQAQPVQMTDKQRRIEELKRETEVLEQKRVQLNKRMQQERKNIQQKAQEKLNSINQVLTTKREMPPEDPYEYLETQSDQGDYRSVHEWDDFDYGNDNVSRGSSNNTKFNILQNKLQALNKRIADDTCIKDSSQMMAISTFIPAMIRNSIDPKHIKIKDDIVKKVTKFDSAFNFAARNSHSNPISSVFTYNSAKSQYMRTARKQQLNYSHLKLF